MIVSISLYNVVQGIRQSYSDDAPEDKEKVLKLLKENLTNLK